MRSHLRAVGCSSRAAPAAGGDRAHAAVSAVQGAGDGEEFPSYPTRASNLSRGLFNGCYGPVLLLSCSSLTPGGSKVLVSPRHARVPQLQCPLPCAVPLCPARHWSSAPLDRCVPGGRPGAHPPEMVLWGFLFVFSVSKLLSVLWGKEQTAALLSPRLSFLLRNVGFTVVLIEIMFGTV